MLVDEDVLRNTLNILRARGFNVSAAARDLEISRSAVRGRLRMIKSKWPSEAIISESNWTQPTEFEYPEIPEPEPSYEELKIRAVADFKILQANREASKLIQVKIKVQGPYGIMLMGDPHIDDSGTDWELLSKDIELVKSTPGLFGANVGDVTNNWIGRLARLYGQQNMSRNRAILMAEGFIREIPWLWLDPGNHDLWSGADDPIKWITRFAGICYKWQGSRLQLITPNGRSIIVNSRHDHPGHSMYHSTHGPLKAAQFDSFHDDIYSCGHIHSGGYMYFVQPNGKKSHIIRLSSYKIYDNHKDEMGFRDHSMPSAVIVVNPEIENQVTFFPEPAEGAKYLTYLRSKK